MPLAPGLHRTRSLCRGSAAAACGPFSHRPCHTPAKKEMGATGGSPTAVLRTTRFKELRKTMLQHTAVAALHYAKWLCGAPSCQVTVGSAGGVGAYRRGRDREEAVLHCISVGLCTPRFSRYAVAKQQAGWDGESWGLHSDDGQLFHASNRGYQFADAKVAGPLTFGAGDVVGCGICQLPASFGDSEASHVTGGGFV